MKKSFLIGGVTIASLLLLGAVYSASSITSLVNEIIMPRATPIAVDLNPEESTTIDLNALLRENNIEKDGTFVTEDVDPTITFNQEKNTADFANTTAGKYPLSYEICTENATLNNLELNYEKPTLPTTDGNEDGDAWGDDTGGDTSIASPDK